MWLWLEKDYFSFDYGYRVEDFAQFEDDAQFASIAENLAQRAAEEVGRLRSLFTSLRSTAGHLAAKSPRGFWDSFHAGVGCGLVGELDEARRFFGDVVNTDDVRDWAQAAALLAREYSAALADVAGFRARIASVIHRTRDLMKLPEVKDIVLD
jgi:hypothetical protein